MPVETLDLSQILLLPQTYGPLIRAVDECRREASRIFNERYVVALNDQGHIIARAGPEAVMELLADAGIAPGFARPDLALQCQTLTAGAVDLGSGLRAFPYSIDHPAGCHLLVAEPPHLPGSSPASVDPVADLLVRHISLRVQWFQEEVARQEFTTERNKLQTFYSLTSELSELSDPDQILAAAARRVTDLLDAGTTIVYGLNPSHTRLVPLVGHDIPADRLHNVRYEIELGQTALSRAYHSGQTRRLDDVSRLNPEEGIPALADLGLRSVLLVPIRLRERPLGVMVIGRYLLRPFDIFQAEVLAFTTHQLALILENARLRATLAARLENLHRELDLAQGMQSLMLPRGSLTGPNYRITGATLPAKRLGGDYFDYLAAEGRLAAIVADIMGKGVSAALLMAILRTHFRSTFQDQPVLSPDSLQRFSQLVHADLKPQRAFATALLMSLDPETRQLSLFSAGHPAPLLIRNGRITAPACPRVAALGLSAPQVTEAAIGRLQLQPGDCLVSYTDGVTDAPVPEGGRLGLPRWREMVGLAAPNGHDADEVLQALLQQVTASSTERADDTTICVLRQR